MSWHRRTLAVVCAVLAVLTTVMAVRAPAAPTVAVWVAKTDLPAGTELTRSNTLELGFLPATVPGGAAGPPEFLGRRTAGPMTRGSPITQTSMVTGALARAGHVLIPVRLADTGLVALLRVGQIVDVHAVNPGGGSGLVARGARVAALPAPRSDGVLEKGSDALVVLEVRETDTSAVMANVTSVMLSLR